MTLRPRTLRGKNSAPLSYLACVALAWRMNRVLVLSDTQKNEKYFTHDGTIYCYLEGRLILTR